MSHNHNFHIPVMGTGFTLETPLKVAHYGIDSVVSIVDDVLIEKMRRVFCDEFEIPYQAISDKIEDFRAKRITAYLNLLNDLTRAKFKALKAGSMESRKEIMAYLQMLPDSSEIKRQFAEMKDFNLPLKDLKNWISTNLSLGSIDVNIMTKLDKPNYSKGEKLPDDYNDAHAALRGFANSDLESSVVFSAGMNPRLYSYIENFDDFYPDATGYIRKKIVIKVSDFRSALIQGKFLAKKGLWVSEYRIESGLNCGGHAFATEGHLMGPILEEFKQKRQELVQTVHEILILSLAERNKCIPKNILPLKISAQGGVGTSEEHQFLLDHYKIDSVGWGTPFLLVPEATTLDEATIEKLISADEKDLYLSNISPLGVPFNNLKGNTKDLEKMEKADKGRPGSPCPKEFLALNSEFGPKGLCTASRQYQRNRISQLDTEEISREDYEKKYRSIVDKSCLCMGLGQASTQVHNLESSKSGKGVSICPGPNMAYFSKIMSLKEITDHIYGRTNGLVSENRPLMFMKELQLYTSYLRNAIEETNGILNKKQQKYFEAFTRNLQEGISYYNSLFDEVKERFSDARMTVAKELKHQSDILESLKSKIDTLLSPK